MERSEKLVIGNEYCDVCETYTPIRAWIDEPEDTENEAPQLYLEGFHTHLAGCDKRIDLPLICIWIEKPEKLKEMLDVLEQRLKNLRD